MGERPQLWKQAACATLGALLLHLGSPCPAQNASRPSVHVTDLRPVHSVDVTMSVFSGNQDLFVPYCGENLPGRELLCGPPAPTHLEVQTAKGWRPVGLKWKSAVLGTLAPERWKARAIPARSWHSFVLVIPKDDLAVDTGVQLRVVIDAWPDERSMRNGARPIQLTTSPFKCP